MKMMKPEQITVALLIKCGISPNNARLFEKPMQDACHRFGINTARRFAAFMGQALVESINFSHLEESLYYTTTERMRQMFSKVNSVAAARGLLRNPKALANRVYANRGGNGDEPSGDGWRYRGRGLFQLTLKDNYAKAQFECKRPYVENPDLVAQPYDAAITAAWYFACHGCNALADEWNIAGITRAINGAAMAGRNQRLLRCEEILELLKDKGL